LGQGRENAKAFLAENLEVMVEISERIRQQVGIGDAKEATEAPAAPAEAALDPDDAPITLD